MTKNEKWDERNRCLRLETQLLQNSKILWLPPLNIEVSNMIAGYTRLRPWHIKKNSCHHIEELKEAPVK